MEPTHFLGIPVTKRVTWCEHWVGERAGISIVLRRQLNVHWTDDESPSPEWWNATLTVGPGISSEFEADNLLQLEEYFRKLVADFKQAAVAVNHLWPD